MKKELSGMYVALMSGFDDHGELNAERQNNITDYAVRQRVRGLYVGGSSAESGLMSTDELLVQQAWISERASGKIDKLIAHVGQPNLADSIKLVRQAAKLEYDALSALPPHSYRFSDQEILSYYQSLAKETDLPLIVYEVPVRTGRDLPMELLDEIMKLPNVAGIKFTSSDLFKLSILRRRHPGKHFYFGFDEIYASAAIMGTDGGIGTTYNVLGNLYVAIDDAIRNSDLVEARRLQVLSQRYIELLFETGVLPGVKLTMQAIGIDCGPVRAPLKLLSKEAAQHLKAFVALPELAKWYANN